VERDGNILLWCMKIRIEQDSSISNCKVNSYYSFSTPDNQSCFSFPPLSPQFIPSSITPAVIKAGSNPGRVADKQASLPLNEGQQATLEHTLGAECAWTPWKAWPADLDPAMEGLAWVGSHLTPATTRSLRVAGGWEDTPRRMVM